MQERAQNHSSIMTSQRRIKQNLACFLNDKIFESNVKSQPSETMENNIYNKKVLSNNMVKHDMNTIENTITSSVNNTKKGNRKQKKSVPTNTLGSAMQSILPEDKVVSPIPTSISIKEKKEDYWYYDKESDGFYYEFAGSRGWKKRNKNTPVQSLPQTTQTFKNKILLPMEIPRPHENESMSNFVYNDFTANKPTLPSTSSSGSLNNKVYDPHSDGYYYNMGSIEGWKRRTDSVTSSKNSCSSPVFNNQQAIRSQMQSTESAVSFDNEWTINNKDVDNKNINEFGSSIQSTGSSAASSILDEGIQPKFFIPNQNSVTSKTYASYFDNVNSNRHQQQPLQYNYKNDSVKQLEFNSMRRNKTFIHNMDIEMQQENDQLINKFNEFKFKEPQIFNTFDTYSSQNTEYTDVFLTNDLNKALNTSEYFNDRSNLTDSTNRDVWGFRTTNSNGDTFTCGGEETDYKALEQIWQNLDNNLLTGGEIGCTN
uniref:WW domain-containing protein n=1 Tax=Parastrongyloides trichosuri TaxID=131310 RepID=A0A0N4ZTJ5_PARTI